MPKRLSVLLLVSLLVPLTVGACTDETETFGSSSQGVVTQNRIAGNRIAGNRIAGNRIAGNRIAGNRIAGNNLSVNSEAMGDLLTTPEGLELLAFLVGCALPEGVSLTAENPTPGQPDIVFFGEIGVAPNWVNRALTKTDRRWVSACLLSRVNDHDVTVEISIRGPHAALATTPQERLSHTVEEGAFYGNIFGDLDKPLQWYACRGRDQASRESGSLDDRDCAEPDPASPGRTHCDFIYAGDCADYLPPRNNYACERFSADGYYIECETAATLSSRGMKHERNDDDSDLDSDTDDSDDSDDSDGDSDAEKGPYDEVITTFLLLP